MQQLNAAILNAAVHAQNRYEAISDYWLWHAPESYLTNYVANGIGRKKWQVWPEASPRKIIVDADGSKRGRRAKNRNRRFDIVVWHKASSTLKAIIEVKLAWSVNSLMRDAEKIRKQQNAKRASARAGYLLVYSEARHEAEKRTGAATLKRRFKKWAKALDANLRGMRLRAPRGEPWAWGFALFRLY